MRFLSTVDIAIAALLPLALAQEYKFWTRPKGVDLCGHNGLSMNCTADTSDFVQQRSKWGGCMANTDFNGYVYCCLPSDKDQPGCRGDSKSCDGINGVAGKDQIQCQMGRDTWCCDKDFEQCPGNTFVSYLCFPKNVSSPIQLKSLDVREPVANRTILGPLGKLPADFLTSPERITESDSPSETTDIDEYPSSTALAEEDTSDTVRVTATLAPGVIAGIVVGILVAMLFTGLLTFLCTRRHFNQKTEQTAVETKFDPTYYNGPTHTRWELDPSGLAPPPPLELPIETTRYELHGR